MRFDHLKSAAVLRHGAQLGITPKAYAKTYVRRFLAHARRCPKPRLP